MLFYTGIKRTAADVADSYVADIETKKRQLRIMKDLVDESMALLNCNGELAGFGELLHEAWQAKRKMSMGRVLKWTYALLYRMHRSHFILGLGQPCATPFPADRGPAEAWTGCRYTPFVCMSRA